MDSVGNQAFGWSVEGQLWGRGEAGLGLEVENPSGSGQCVSVYVCVCQGVGGPHHDLSLD